MNSNQSNNQSNNLSTYQLLPLRKLSLHSSPCLGRLTLNPQRLGLFVSPELPLHNNYLLEPKKRVFSRPQCSFTNERIEGFLFSDPTTMTSPESPASLAGEAPRLRSRSAGRTSPQRSRRHRLTSSCCLQTGDPPADGSGEEECYRKKFRELLG